MTINYDQKNNSISILTARSSYQMKIGRYGHLLHLYYGARTEAPMDGRITLLDRGFSGNPYAADTDRTYSLDALPQEFPTQGTGDYRSPLLKVADAQGIYGCDLRYVSHRIRDGKYSLPGLPAVFAKAGQGADDAQTLEVLLRCDSPQMEVTLLYGVLPKLDVITRSAVIHNTGTEPITIKKAQAACLDFLESDRPEGGFDRIIFYGRHTMERIPDRRGVGPGSYVIGSRRGFSSHQYNPFMILCDGDATEDFGRCWSMQFVYSGGFKAEIEEDQYGQTRMQMGLMEDRFAWTLLPEGTRSGRSRSPEEPASKLILPEVILSFSDEGLSRLSRNHHDCIREHICRFPARDDQAPQPATPRWPVLLNSWEACYFDFDGEKVCRMAEEAKDLGMDLVVLDDGWFGNRNDDLRALGDWDPNEEKLGCSLGELSERIHVMGLQFGIWMEPEMVSEDSNLYREHPDWVLRIPGRDPIRSRYQLVLDLSRPDVVEGIYERICKVLDSARIEYLKWDANRHIADLYSVEAAEDSDTSAVPAFRVKPSGMILHQYVLGLYSLLERLRQRYPGLLMEGCCGGGGRFDAGMLYYTPQIWCSDNTDPIDRLTIQYGTSFGYPLCTMGAHVAASPNHVTGRVTSLDTRGIAAMAGTFGYELDPGKLTPEAKDVVRRQIGLYRQDAALVRDGDYYRLADPVRDPLGAWMIVSKAGEAAIAAAIMNGTASKEIAPKETAPEATAPKESGIRLRLRGLDPEAIYRIEETGQKKKGRELMEKGIEVLPGKDDPYQGYVFHLASCRK